MDSGALMAIVAGVFVAVGAAIWVATRTGQDGKE